MAVAYSNGHNKSGEAPEPTPVIKAPVIDVPEQPRLCCERIAHGSWCNLLDGHPGEHHGAAPTYGPIEERPALWRKHRGQQP